MSQATILYFRWQPSLEDKSRWQVELSRFELRIRDQGEPTMIKSKPQANALRTLLHPSSGHRDISTPLSLDLESKLLLGGHPI